MTQRTRTLWTFAITSIALFMVSLDNLVVSTAIPVIRVDLHASLESLSWTVNAYTLTFAVLLLTGAALGDRFGRRRMFAIGVSIFTLASVAAALAPSVEVLNIARAVQGLGGAIVMPLTLTILSASVPPARRGLALGAWGAIGGLAIAFGPVVGGAVVEGFSWQYIFWLNVPDWNRARATGTHATDGDAQGRPASSTCPASALVSAGMFGIVWGLYPRQRAGLDEPGDPGGPRARHRPRGGLRRLGAACPAPDAADDVLPERGVLTSRTSPRCSCSSGCSARSSC